MSELVPAPTSHTILCNVAQQVQSYLDLPPGGLVDTVVIPRDHLRRWLELVHRAVMLLDALLAAARGVGFPGEMEKFWALVVHQSAIDGSHCR